MDFPPWTLPPARDPVGAGRCFGCRMPPFACFCAEIPVIQSRTRVVIIRHRSEIHLTSNTGRVVARAMPNSVLVDHGLPGPRLDLSEVLGEDAWLLAPGGAPVVAPTVRTLIVLDCTWSQIQSMWRRIEPLPRLPLLSLPAPVVAPLRMRRGYGDHQLATIEAVAAGLEVIGEPEPAAQLRAVFHTMAETMQRLRGFEMPPKVRPGQGRNA